MFSHVSKQWWTVQNQKVFMRHLRRSLGLDKQLSDLYQLSLESITQYGGMFYVV